jgi:hypothetical protein
MAYVDEIFSDQMESRLILCLYTSCICNKQLGTYNCGSLLLHSVIYNIETLCFISFVNFRTFIF